MKLKLFHVLLITLPAYGITISIANFIHNSIVYESQLYFFNIIVETVVVPSLASLFFGIGNFVGLLIVLSNLIFWIPVAFLVLILKHKMKYKIKEK